jgi:hypothetical protein
MPVWHSFLLSTVVEDPPDEPGAIETGLDFSNRHDGPAEET